MKTIKTKEQVQREDKAMQKLAKALELKDRGVFTAEQRADLVIDLQAAGFTLVQIEKSLNDYGFNKAPSTTN